PYRYSRMLSILICFGFVIGMVNNVESFRLFDDALNIADKRIVTGDPLRSARLNAICSNLCRKIFRTGGAFCSGLFTVALGYPDCVCNQSCQA
uniref:Kazal-like domain-containing protein n=1 Tax=Macrostomum lignano TaxID=282301 RepID=A0A1I8G4C8_9PLAT